MYLFNFWWWWWGGALALQYKTASASETVIGPFSFLQFRGKSQTCMAGDRGLHDAVFYGFPQKLRLKPNIANVFSVEISLVPRRVSLITGMEYGMEYGIER